MNTGKFDGMYKLLFDYKHEISRNIPDNLKCAKCVNILINACQVPCGCQYCYDCINEMLQSSVVNCPGSTDDCKQEYLSNNQLDFRANKSISKLIVKCPEEMCSHECELIKMEEHLRICGKKSMKCPFSDLGCDNRKMASGILNEHCQSSNFSHCKILIEMIDNIKNDIDSLKVKEINNEIKIEKLENELKVKSELIDSFNKEMESIKLENENLKQQIHSLKENVGKRFEEISKEMKDENLQIIESINKQIIEIKIEKDEMKQEYEDTKDNLEEMSVEVKKENQERLESINALTIETNNKSEMMETKINKVIDKSKYATIDWTIDKLIERKNKKETIYSEYFTSIIKPYKLRLIFHADGVNDFIGKGCSIFLHVCSDANDNSLSWPFKGDVTISIVNKTNPNLNKTITKYCEIYKPPSNSYSSSRYCNPRIQFDYSYEDLSRDGVMQNDCFIVECFINFK